MKWEETLEFKHCTIQFFVYFIFTLIVFLLLVAFLSCTVGPPVLCFSIELFNKTRQLLVQLLDVIQQPRLLVEAGSGRLCSIRDVSILTKEKCSNKKSMNLKNAFYNLR